MIFLKIEENNGIKNNWNNKISIKVKINPASQEKIIISKNSVPKDYKDEFK